MNDLQMKALAISELKAMIADAQAYEEIEGEKDGELPLFKELLRVDRQFFMACSSKEERRAAMKWVVSYLDGYESAPVPADEIIRQIRRMSRMRRR